MAFGDSRCTIFKTSSLLLDRRKLLGGAAAVGLAAPLAWTRTLSQGLVVSAQEGGTAVVANYSMPPDLDPGELPGFQAWFVIQNVCEGLTKIVLNADGQIEIEPLLAESYEQSADGSAWTFTLRPDVRFHDGTPFNAEAVIFSHERMMNPDHPHYDPRYSQLGEPLDQIIEQIEAVDDATVRFTLRQPANPYFLNWEAFAMAVSPTAVEEFGPEFGLNIIGTGPFRLDRFDATGNTIEVSRNPDYWEPDLPKLERAVFNAIPEPATRLAVLETGDADIGTIMPTEFAARIEGNPDLLLAAADVPNFNMIEFYRGVPPFDNLLVRQAVAHALDREALANTLYGGYWTPAINNRWPGMPGWADYQPYPYDPERARALLAEAGYENGVEFTLDMPASSSGNPAGSRWGELIQEQLAAVGFTVQLNVVEAASFWNMINEPRAATAHYMSRQIFIGDVVNEWLTFWIDPPQGTPWDMPVPGLAELNAQLQETADPAAYDELVTQMWQVVDDEVPYIAIAVGSWLTGVRRALTGFEPQGLGQYLSLREASLA
jgi:peptide/nickel transport system substrate-binding protein